ncbi:MAG: hypothetical protein GY835_27510 [bacterium]|nr:hypothetical protein [bacterium]
MNKEKEQEWNPSESGDYRIPAPGDSRAGLDRDSLSTIVPTAKIAVGTALVAILAAIISLSFSLLSLSSGSSGRQLAAIELWTHWDKAFDPTNRSRFNNFVHWTETSPGEVQQWVRFFVDGNNSIIEQIDAHQQRHPSPGLRYLFEDDTPTPDEFEQYKYSLTTILNTMERIVIARNQGLVDPDVIDRSYGDTIPRYVTRLRPFIEEYSNRIPNAWKELIESEWSQPQPDPTQ